MPSVYDAFLDFVKKYSNRADPEWSADVAALLRIAAQADTVVEAKSPDQAVLANIHRLLLEAHQAGEDLSTVVSRISNEIDAQRAPHEMTTIRSMLRRLEHQAVSRNRKGQKG